MSTDWVSSMSTNSFISWLCTYDAICSSLRASWRITTMPLKCNLNHIWVSMLLHVDLVLNKFCQRRWILDADLINQTKNESGYALKVGERSMEDISVLCLLNIGDA